MTVERRFPKSIDALEQVFAFVDETLDPVTGDERVRYALTLGAEEFFTNCVKYNLRSAHDILVRIRTAPRSIILQILDDDVEPFDVTRSVPRDLNASIDGKRVGGLGIHLSRELLDDLAYEYAGGTSIVTMTMKLEA